MMRNGLLVTGFVVLATVTLAPLPAAAQSKKASTPARNPDGTPNLAGIYSFSTITPLQRPEALAGKATLTNDEAAAFESSENTRLNRDLFDPIKGQPSAGYAPRAEGGVLPGVAVTSTQTDTGFTRTAVSDGQAARPFRVLTARRTHSLGRRRPSISRNMIVLR